MTNIHKDILIIFFQAYIENGVDPRETPLFTGTYDLEPIEKVISDFYKVSAHDAEEAVKLARDEVSHLLGPKN